MRESVYSALTFRWSSREKVLGGNFWQNSGEKTFSRLFSKYLNYKTVKVNSTTLTNTHVSIRILTPGHYRTHPSNLFFIPDTVLD